jgi:hypothetical protein
MADGNGRVVQAEQLISAADEMTNRERLEFRRACQRMTVFLENAVSARSQILQKITTTDSRRSIDESCGYPDESDVIDAATYHQYYVRHDISARVVNMLPNECWKVQPKITETKDAEEDTEFEKSLAELNRQLSGSRKFNDEEHNFLMAKLYEADRKAGVGDFGIILLGIKDGKTFDQPVDSIDEEGNRREGVTTNYELLYITTFDRSEVSIKETDPNEQSRRYGQPLLYEVKFYDTDGNVRNTELVHWHRVIHVPSDDGRPRMELVFNRLYDLRKVFGASGEGYWLSAIQKLFFKKQEGYEDVEMTSTQKANLREDVYQFFNSLQRHLNLEGLEAYALPPEMADPLPHFELHVKAICIVIEVPYRIFMGSEEARLAGSQDRENLEPRIKRRQRHRLTPELIVPTIDRLIAIGALVEPAQEYFVEWPDLSAPSDQDKAQVALTVTEALAKYVSGNVGQAMILADFLSFVFRGLFTDDEIETIIENALEQATEDEEEEERKLIEGEQRGEDRAVRLEKVKQGGFDGEEND